MFNNKSFKFNYSIELSILAGMSINIPTKTFKEQHNILHSSVMFWNTFNYLSNLSLMIAIYTKSI